MVLNHLGPVEAFKHRANQCAKSWFYGHSAEFPARISVEGMGDWGKGIYRPALEYGKSTERKLNALYRDILPTLSADELAPWEQFEIKSDPLAPIETEQDLLFVVTPDKTHIEVLEASLGQFDIAIVEKPFCTDQDTIRRARHLVSTGISLWGVDHYPFYIANAIADAAKIWEHLGRQITRIDFVLLQTRPIEPKRIPSLTLGLGFDMLPHFLALVVALGLKGKVEKPNIRCAAQHAMQIPEQDTTPTTSLEVYEAETCLDVEFQIADRDGNKNINCRGVVGKGMPIDAKYLDLFGINNTAVRFDMGSDLRYQKSYPRNKVSYLSRYKSPLSASNDLLGTLAGDWRVIQGPQLNTERAYNYLMKDLLSGSLTPSTAACLFTVEECTWIVEVLEAIRIQLVTLLEANGNIWPSYTLGEFPTGWDSKVWIP